MLACEEVDVVATWVSAVDLDLACDELGECVPIIVFDDRPEAETLSRRSRCSRAAGFGRLRGIGGLLSADC